MYEFHGLQPPTKRKKTVQKEKKNINVCECAFRKYWSEKRPWLKYILKKTKSMHCVTGHKAAEVDEPIKPKKMYKQGLTN